MATGANARLDTNLLLEARLQICSEDLDRLDQILKSQPVKRVYEGTLVGVFQRLAGPVRARLARLRGSTMEAESWRELAVVRRESQQLMQQALAFLGGSAIRGMAATAPACDRALALARRYAADAGIDWSPAIVPGECDHNPPGVADDGEGVGDAIVLLRIPQWDIFRLPLLAHDYGHWIAQRGRIRGFDEFIASQQPAVQKAELWRVVADAFAAYLVGPAYAHAVLFLELDPGGVAAGTDSRGFPGSTRRAAVIFGILRDADTRLKDDDPYADGPYTTELNLLETTWESALGAGSSAYTSEQAAVAGWCRSLGDVLQTHFPHLGRQAANQWTRSRDTIGPALCGGMPPAAAPDLAEAVGGAWWCRCRQPELASEIASGCENLLLGRRPAPEIQPAGEKASGVVRLLRSRLYDGAQDILRIQKLLDSDAIETADREAVMGKFKRMLSERDFELAGLQRLFRLDPSSGSALGEALQLSDGPAMRALRRELLDFLGGTMMRTQNLEGGSCRIAEDLLREFSRLTGINWASRVVVGINPLFSPASELVHVRFPDWDIWNAPLMAHEFGHIAAPLTPGFGELLETEVATSRAGHPESPGWSDDRAREYSAQRGLHVHELFADAFAAYCQGPAFAYCALQLNFEPAEAHAARGSHPTHAERVNVICQVLRSMNSQAKEDRYDSGPYAAVIARLEDWWANAAESPAAPADGERFHLLRAKALSPKIQGLLDRYYRLGAQYRGEDWERAETAAERLVRDEEEPAPLGLRHLLNIAWAGRVKYPGRAAMISKLVRSAWSRRAEQGAGA